MTRTRSDPRATALARVALTAIALILIHAREARAEFDKDICNRRCDDTAVAKSLSGAEWRAGGYGGQAAAVILLCHAGCELGRYPNESTLHWDETQAVARECKGTNRVYHLPCADADHLWTLHHRKCLGGKGTDGYPQTFRGQKLPSPGKDIDNNWTPDDAWIQIEVPEDSCKMDWADARAHDKGCRGTEHIFHVRCERPDESWSDECSDMTTRPFLQRTMTKPPKRLADKAWSEVATDDGTCGVAWAEASAHDKGCRMLAQRAFHVRCERPDGSASDQCADMANHIFQARAPMLGNPVRLKDRAWTEVVVVDGTCN